MIRPLIDDASLEEFTQDDPDLLADLSVIFVRTLPSSIAKIRSSIECGNSETIRECAHQLKSQLSYFFCESLVGQAQELEELGRQGDLAHADRLLNDLCAQLSELVNELNQRTHLSLTIEEEE